ncbi:hypothetical protein ARSEF1564_008976 [Beauveria bassiana]
MISMDASDLELSSTAYSDLDAVTDLSEFDVNREATADTTSSAAHSGYEGVDWNRLPGGENLADRVSEIIYEYDLNGRVGYFITDNAESNDTCLDELAGELGFKK